MRSLHATIKQFKTRFTGNNRDKGPHNCQSMVSFHTLIKSFRDLKWLHNPRSTHAKVWDHKYIFRLLTRYLVTSSCFSDIVQDYIDSPSS